MNANVMCIWDKALFIRRALSYWIVFTIVLVLACGRDDLLMKWTIAESFSRGVNGEPFTIYRCFQGSIGGFLRCLGEMFRSVGRPLVFGLRPAHGPEGECSIA